MLQARLQQYVNHELPDVQAGFRKGRGQIANIQWIIEKAREFQKNIYFCFIDYAKDENTKGIKAPTTLTAAQKERVYEQGQTLSTKGEMLYLLFTAC